MKLLACDLDGTLLENHQSVSKENLNAIKLLRENGNKFVIATGRGVSNTSFLKSEYQIDYDYLILLNGALLVDKENRIVKRDVISFEVCRRIYDMFYKEGPEFAFSTGENFFALKDVENKSFGEVELLSSVDELKAFKVSLMAIDFKNLPVDIVQNYVDNLNSLLGSEIIAFRNTHGIDVVSKGNSKGGSVEYVSTLFDIEMKDVYTIGDSWNDVSMFDVTENSYTFHYVEHNLKKHANYIVDSVHDCIRDILN